MEAGQHTLGIESHGSVADHSARNAGAAGGTGTGGAPARSRSPMAAAGREADADHDRLEGPASALAAQADVLPFVLLGPEHERGWGVAARGGGSQPGRSGGGNLAGGGGGRRAVGGGQAGDSNDRGSQAGCLSAATAGGATRSLFELGLLDSEDD